MNSFAIVTHFEMKRPKETWQWTYAYLPNSETFEKLSVKSTWQILQSEKMLQMKPTEPYLVLQIFILVHLTE